MKEDTKVVYCRHQFSKRPNLLKKLWKRRWIAIHFEDKPTADPDAYGPKGRNALRRLKKYCETGVIVAARSEEHTSELQSRVDLVCRLLLEKKKKKRR